MKQKKIRILLHFLTCVCIMISHSCCAMRAIRTLFAAAPGYGTTHFIVGSPKVRVHMTQPAAAQKVREAVASTPLTPAVPTVPLPHPFLCKSDGSLCQVFFSPEDGLREKLIQLIDAEQEAINIAVFTFTDKEIAHALLRARARGVTLAIVVDPVCVRDRYNKIGMLCDQKVCTFVYNAQHAKDGMSSSMHHKFAIFKKNMGNRSLLWTGSFNFTRSATLSNHENAFILDDTQIIAQFERQFTQIQNQSYRYKIDKKNHANA